MPDEIVSAVEQIEEPELIQLSLQLEPSKYETLRAVGKLCRAVAGARRGLGPMPNCFVLPKTADPATRLQDSAGAQRIASELTNPAVAALFHALSRACQRDADAMRHAIAHGAASLN